MSLPSDPRRAVLLQRIGDRTATGTPETAEMLRELTERGTTSWMILDTDDCKATFAELSKKGVDIIQEPTEQMYGIDMAIRDPSETKSASRRRSTNQQPADGVSERAWLRQSPARKPWMTGTTPSLLVPVVKQYGQIGRTTSRVGLVIMTSSEN